jgi:hypothetical protein
MTKAQSLGITEFPYEEFDSNGKRTYYENAKGYWVKREYNSDGKCTYCENTKKAGGYHDKWKKEYDVYGNVVYYEDLRDKLEEPYWYRCEFKAKKQCLSFINSDGFGFTQEFDEAGNLISVKNSWEK